ncbi:MAG: hypothetical protein LBK94_06845 [Prevotellaceae bacterium]|jgi:hypothetical protein|nr:hypothetical protein [Prevotellaceae bacterium]
MKQKNEMAPMSAQERKEDIDMLMSLEMQDSIIGGACEKQCQTCKSGCSNNTKNVVVVKALE